MLIQTGWCQGSVKLCRLVIEVSSEVVMVVGGAMVVNLVRGGVVVMVRASADAGTSAVRLNEIRLILNRENRLRFHSV
jgi:hypothetical protein